MIDNLIKDVTVLIPCYNEEKFIMEAVLSAAKQAEYVIISDNCSTDNTASICKNIAKEYSNVLFFEQKKNLGISKNSEFLVNQIKTSYVSSMGAHDILSKNYLYELKNAITNNQQTVMSYAPVVQIDEGGNTIGFYNMEDLEMGLNSFNPFQRVFTIISNLTDCSVGFGLIKTDLVKKFIFMKPKAGNDHLLFTKIAKEGRIIKVNSTKFYRRFLSREDSTEAYMKRITSSNSKKFDLSYVCIEQFKLIKNIKTNNFKEKLFFQNLAKESLQKRWGRYCDENTIKKLKKLKLNNKKFILYGSGSGADLVLNILKESILYIVDKDEQKHGKMKNDIIIKSLDSLYINEDCKIIISILSDTQSIIKDLVQKNIDYDRLISLNILD